ncbi:hypothetical protein MRX56_12570 [Pseudodesulfovibrio sp. S3-i]|uniref:hypothetical protein n=1 Tax=Pseudodesulfovibrio sp. S3-i TaxID=2929474 RepID=UPI001FB8CB7D|nr:hypothetical protein [Pseudodesulfovibrio sp. S3-i]MCJ2165385.1 hypothetical protein [Pseudodesulfovibrio sp. S3-i]
MPPITGRPKSKAAFFWFFFGAAQPKKNPAGRAEKKHGGAMSDGSSSNLLKGEYTHIGTEGHGMPLVRHAPNNASRAKAAHPKQKAAPWAAFHISFHLT